MCNIQNKGFRRKGAGVNSRKILSRGGEVLTGYCFTLNVCFKCLLSRYMPTFTVHCTLFDVHVTNKILNLKSYQHSYQIVLNRWQVAGLVCKHAEVIYGSFPAPRDRYRRKKRAKHKHLYSCGFSIKSTAKQPS